MEVAEDDGPLDPRRWITFGIVMATVVLAVIDSTVLNVSLPTILRELDTTVPTVQWVITGYSLVIASLLIIGGRLGDIYGHRRMFVIGVSLFGIGSLVASEAHGVGQLIVGEAIIEGIGAAMMIPATLAILTVTFRGRERSKAFAGWGAASGVAVAFGPVLGGFLTTNYSWRWAFRINVVVAPIAVIGALLLMRKGKRVERVPVDLPGAALIASGMFLVVFGLSEAGRYGWWRPLEAFRIGDATVWPTTSPVALSPTCLVLGTVILVGFFRLERNKARRGAHPLLDVTLMQFPSFRYGLATLLILALGQLAMLIALPLFLQNAVHLSAQENGWWLVPIGVFVIIGSQIGGRMTHLVNTTKLIRLGLILEALSFVLMVFVVTPGLTFWGVAPGLSLFGLGIGLASSQLQGVVLSEVPRDRAGVAGGALTTARQIGQSLGGAVVGTLITVQTTNHALDAVSRSTALPADVQRQAAAGLRELGPNWSPPSGVSASQRSVLERVFNDALSHGARSTLLFASVVVGIGAAISFLIPLVRMTDTATAEPLDDQSIDASIS